MSVPGAIGPGGDGPPVSRWVLIVERIGAVEPEQQAIRVETAGSVGARVSELSGRTFTAEGALVVHACRQAHAIVETFAAFVDVDALDPARLEALGTRR